jgi:hypothetical protein
MAAIISMATIPVSLKDFSTSYKAHDEEITRLESTGPLVEDNGSASSFPNVLAFLQSFSIICQVFDTRQNRDGLVVAQLIEFIMERHDFDLGFQIYLVIVVCVDPVMLRLPVSASS